MSEANEAGNRPQRIEFVRESEAGVTPSNPAWEAFSDTVASIWDWEPDANVESQRGVGDPDSKGFFAGSETHEASFSYHLQRWFVDGSGNPLDAAGDAMLRDADNNLYNTHSVVTREEHATGGNDSAGRRIYHVGKGGRASSVTVPFETESGLPIEIDLSYQFGKIRTYEIHQPADSTTVTVYSSSSNDTQDVTVEDEGAATSETLTLNGTTSVTSTATFTDIDAIELSAETEGDITIEDDAGVTLAKLNGSQHYDGVEGDLGVPILGTGSHASAIGTAYESFIDDALAYSGGSEIAPEIQSGEMSVENDINADAQLGTKRQAIDVGDRTVMVTATVAGPAYSHEQQLDYFSATGEDIDWTADGGTVTFPSATLMSAGSVSKEQGQAKMTLDNEFEAVGLTIN